MNQIFNAVKLFVMVIFLCGIIFIGGKASAAEIDVEAMQIFRETLTQTNKTDTRVFHQDIYFVLPKFTSKLEFLGSTEKDSLNMTGRFGYWMVNSDGKDEKNIYPFYIAQDKKNMTLYFQDDKKWKKMTSPTSAATMVDMFATPNAQELEELITFVKDVTVLQESEKSRTLLVKIDGGKIFDEIKAEMDKDPAIQKQKNDETLNTIASYIEAAFRNSDIWYTWTVDKVNWQTTTMSFNLSSLIQTMAYSALNDSSNPLNSIDEFREILESVAFYSDFKGYTTFLNSEAKSRLEIPKKVLKAKEVENFSDDDKKSKKNS